VILTQDLKVGQSSGKASLRILCSWKPEDWIELSHMENNYPGCIGLCSEEAGVLRKLHRGAATCMTVTASHGAYWK
jgi:hypothetical protein